MNIPIVPNSDRVGGLCVGRTFLSDAFDFGLDLDLDFDFSQAAIKASDIRNVVAAQVRKPLISSMT